MEVLIVGATGATGRLLTKQLLDRGHTVKVIVRTAERLPAELREHSNLSVTEASVLDLSAEQMAEQVKGCDAVASCLGHNLTLKGIYGKPRRLVTDATRRLCAAARVSHPDAKTKFVLMNTTGNRNRDLTEQVSLAERIVVGLLRLLLPPQADNEQAAEFLRRNIGRNDPQIEWVAVRPDNLIDEDAATDYDLHPSPVRSAIFDAGKTSRINVAHFMAELIANEETWQTWRGQMPAIDNRPCS